MWDAVCVAHLALFLSSCGRTRFKLASISKYEFWETIGQQNINNKKKGEILSQENILIWEEV